MNLSHIRKDYSGKALRETEVEKNPVLQFKIWFEEALNAEVEEANAFSLATCGKNMHPSVRTVLLKEFDERGFVFCTNYESRKGIQLFENPNAAAVFFWRELMRQVKIEGSVEKVSTAESENYFHARPVEAQVGATISRQSTALDSREWLDEKFQEALQKFSAAKVDLPEWWGGYRIIPQRIEFWQGQASRLHDRICYLKERDRWIIQRLYP